MHQKKFLSPKENTPPETPHLIFVIFFLASHYVIMLHICIIYAYWL